MIFQDFENIDINADFGVSPPGLDTMIVAKHIRKLKFNSALEVGTGTGFIPIYLTKCGLNCDGSDINITAIGCANKNAERNHCKVNFYISDLFENIKNKYDLIIFNPPLGNARSPVLNKYLEIFKYLLPRQSMLLHKIIFRLIARKQRNKLFVRFFNSCQNFLTKNGHVLIFLDHSEFSLIDKNLSYEILDSYYNNTMQLTLIKY